MQHYEIDQYSRSSTLYHFDPRVKLASAVALIVMTAFLRSLEAVLVVLLFTSALVVVSRVPFRHLWKSVSLALPFVIIPAVALYFTTGPLPAAVMALRILSSVLALTAVVTTTPLFDLLKTLRWYRMPKLLSALILFTYRFIFVLLDEMDRMKLARQARGYTGRGNLFSKEIFNTISCTAGMTFVRSHRRANSIYDALLARGYNGELRMGRELKMGARDIGFATTFLTVGALSFMLQAGMVSWTLFI